MSGLNVFPVLSFHDSANVVGVNIKGSSKSCLGDRSIFVKPTNPFYVGFCQSCISIFLTSKTASVYTILHVPFVSACIQVIRIKTAWIMTCMTDLMTFRNFSFKDQIRNMRDIMQLASKANVPVSLSVFSPCPFPAAIRNDLGSINESTPNRTKLRACRPKWSGALKTAFHRLLMPLILKSYE